MSCKREASYFLKIPDGERQLVYTHCSFHVSPQFSRLIFLPSSFSRGFFRLYTSASSSLNEIQSPLRSVSTVTRRYASFNCEWLRFASDRRRVVAIVALQTFHFCSFAKNTLLILTALYFCSFFVNTENRSTQLSKILDFIGLRTYLDRQQSFLSFRGQTSRYYFFYLLNRMQIARKIICVIFIAVIRTF